MKKTVRFIILASKNRVCAARYFIACGFSTDYIWVLCVLKTPFLVKDAPSKNNTLAEKGVAHFPRYHYAKPIRGAKSSSHCVWTRCLWNGCISNSRRIFQTLKRKTLTACVKLRVLVYEVSCTCCSIFCSLVGIHAILIRSLSALRNEPVTPNFWFRLAKKLWLGIHLFGYRSAYKHCVAGPLRSTAPYADGISAHSEFL